MAKPLKLAIALTCAAGALFLAAGLYNRFPSFTTAVGFHREKQSTDCGELSDGSTQRLHEDADSVVHCAVVAHEQHRSFVVRFKVHGVDAELSSAIVGNSSGGGVELFYASGMFEKANHVFQHNCDQRQLFVEPPTVYNVPILHCQPWPSSYLERDYLLW